MRRVFLSHRHHDAAAASALKDRILAERPSYTILQSSDSNGRLAPGQTWRNWIVNAIESADLVLFLADDQPTSEWCNAEVGMALMSEVPVVPIALEAEAVVNPLIADRQMADLDQPVSSLLHILDAGPTATDFDFDSGPVPLDFVPYPGLVPLGPGQEPLLCGRDEDLRRVLADFRRIGPEGARIVVVAGPSGVGKSSFLRAGLLPRLRAAGWQSSGPYRPTDLPDDDDVAWPDGEATVGRVLVVDQFESLFTLAAEQQESIVDRLRAARRAGVVVLVAVRVEFRAELDGLFDDPIDHYLSPLSPADLYEVIRRPARLVQLQVREALVDRLVLETGSGAALPLLAYTLGELWQRRDPIANQLLESELDRLGGVPGILDAAADRALQAASEGDPEHRAGVLSMLSRLASPLLSTPTKVPLSLSLINDQERRWLDHFVEAGLVVYRQLVGPAAAEGGPTTEDIAEVTHDRLFDWRPLVDTIGQRRDTNQVLRSIEEAARSWASSDQSDDFLVSGDRLALAEQAFGTTPDPTVAAYLARSRRRDRNTRLRRRLTALLTVLLAVAVVLVVVASIQTVAANRSERVARAVRVAAQANDRIEDQRDVALLASAAAYRIDPNVLTEGALLDAVASPFGPRSFLEGDDAIWPTLAASPDGRALVADRSRSPAWVDLTTGELTPVSPWGEVQINRIDWAPAASIFVTVGRRPPDRWVVTLVAASGQVLAEVDQAREVTAVTASDREVYLGDFDGVVRRWAWSEPDSTPVELTTLDRGPVTDLEVSPDGGWLAVAASTGLQVHPLDRAASRAQSLLTASAGLPGAEHVIFVPGPELQVVAAGTDPLLQRWTLDGERFAPKAPLGRHLGKVEALAVSADGQRLYSGGLDGTVQVWDVELGGLAGPALRAHRTDVVTMVALAGRGLVSADPERAVVWDLNSGRVVSRPGVVPPEWVGLGLVSVAADGAGELGALTVDGRLARPARDDVTLPIPPQRLWLVDEARAVVLGRASPLDQRLYLVDDEPTEPGELTELTELAAAVVAADAGSCLAAVVLEARLAFHDVGRCGQEPGSIGLDGRQFRPGLPATVALTDDERLVGVTYGFDRVEVYEVATGRLVTAGRTGQSVAATAAAWLGDDRLVVGFDRGGVMQVFEIGDGDGWAAVTEITGHDDAVRAIVTDPVGERIYSAGEDGRLVTTAMPGGRAVGSPRLAIERKAENDPAALVRDLQLLAEDRVLLAIHGGRLVAWELDPLRLAALACRLAGRQLTPAEVTRLDLSASEAIC